MTQIVIWEENTEKTEQTLILTIMFRNLDDRHHCFWLIYLLLSFKQKSETVQIKSKRTLNDAGKLLNHNEGCLVRL